MRNRIANSLAAALLTAIMASALLLSGCNRTPSQSHPSGPVLHARFDLPEGFPVVVPATFQGVDYRFVFDTGCSVTSFSDIHKDILGAYACDVNATGSLNQTMKMAYHEFGAGQLLQIGGIKVAGRVGVADYSQFGQWMTEYDGLLGMDVLGRFVVQLDFENSTLRILDNATPDPNQWGQPFDIYLSGGTPHIDLQLPGGITESFMIDTASPRCYLRQESFKKLVHHLNPRARYTPEKITSDTPSLEALQLRDYELPPLKYKKLLFCEYPRSFLGMEFLRLHSSVTFDFPHAKMYLRPRQPVHEQ